MGRTFHFEGGYYLEGVGRHRKGDLSPLREFLLGLVSRMDCAPLFRQSSVITRFCQVLVVFLAIITVACGGGLSSPQSSSSTPPPTSTTPTPLPLGTVTIPTAPPAVCATGYLVGAECTLAQVTCPNTASIGVSFGITQPTGPVSGTVFLFSSGHGRKPYTDGVDSPDAYVSAGYRVVQMAWDTDWEDTGLSTKNIKAAACRGVTLMNYILQNVLGASATEATCAQGYSAGSAALGYALAWYGADKYLDKVELISGPVLSDIAQGCVVPGAAPITVCGTGQLGCDGPAFQDSPSYVTSAISLVQAWTGDPSCQGGTSTSAQSYSTWKAMSIVDGTKDALFNYPNTALTGWVCNDGANNSAAQGQYFYQQFTSSSQTAAFSLNPVSNCYGAEDIDVGQTSSGDNAGKALIADMLNSQSGCVKRH